MSYSPPPLSYLFQPPLSLTSFLPTSFLGFVPFLLPIIASAVSVSEISVLYVLGAFDLGELKIAAFTAGMGRRKSWPALHLCALQYLSLHKQPPTVCWFSPLSAQVSIRLRHWTETCPITVCFFLDPYSRNSNSFSPLLGLSKFRVSGL